MTRTPASELADVTINDWQGTSLTVGSGYVETNGVKLHFVTAGSGPLLLLLAGAGNYWGDWRSQIVAFARDYQVVAVDLRGHNLSDAPLDETSLDHATLVKDIDGVIDAFGAESAIVVGHDLGGMVTWSYAMARPERTRLAVVVDALHPRALIRELAINPEQAEAADYVRKFQASGSFTYEFLMELAKGRRRDDDDRSYQMRVDAAERSSGEWLSGWYRTNYPVPPYRLDSAGWGNDFPNIKVPLLLLKANPGKGLKVNGLNELWNWVESELTIVTKGIGHFMMDEDPEWVTTTILSWLERQRG